jgi:hypothetical protein
MIKTIFLLAALIHAGSSCFPGADLIIDQLRAQLGITAIVTGGTNSTGATDQFVEQAPQLNCDFENIANCRWSNLGQFLRPQVDTEEWWLFQKTSNVNGAFQLLGPPGRAPADGGKVILAGGQGTPAQVDGKAAIWMSDPIRCMENNAQLTFEYWIYLGSKVRAMVLDATTFEPLWTSADGECPALPTNVFGGGLDGVCRVTVPPQDRPFRVAVQGYNFKDSFVIIDTITFNAIFGSLCDGSLDFGTTSSTLVSGLTGTGIETGSDLNCPPTLGGTCKWGNTGGEPDFQVQTGTVDPSKWYTATGHSATPTGDFLMVTGTDDGGSAVLNSEKIDCQTGDGLMQLKAWFTQGVIMQVCVVDSITNAVRTCEVLDRAAGPEYFVVITGDLQDAYIQINAENFGAGGMAAVDDVTYEADMCSQLLITNPSTVRIPYEGAPIGVITSNAQLACTVDAPDSCQWGDPDPNHQWWWLQGVDQSKLRVFSGASIAPQGGAAYYEFTEDQADVSFFGSDEMYCIKSDGDFVFNVWSTPNVELEVCAIIYTEQREICRPLGVVANQPGPARVAFTKAELGNGRQPVVFILTFYSSGQGFVMIDDLQFTGQVCTEPNLTTPDEELCLALSSGFSGTTFDSAASYWKNGFSDLPSNMATGMQPWEVKYTGFGEKNTRINGHAEAPFPMLGVTLPVVFDSNQQDTGPGIAILQSQELQFETARLVSFSYQRGTFGSQIYVCKDRVPNLVRRDIPFGDSKCTRLAGPSLAAEEWLFGASASFIIEPTDQRVFIVGIAPWKYYYGTTHMVIDGVQVHQGTSIDTPPLCVPTE